MIHGLPENVNITARIIPKAIKQTWTFFHNILYFKWDKMQVCWLSKTGFTYTINKIPWQQRLTYLNMLLSLPEKHKKQSNPRDKYFFFWNILYIWASLKLQYKCDEIIALGILQWEQRDSSMIKFLCYLKYHPHC